MCFFIITVLTFPNFQITQSDVHFGVPKKRKVATHIISDKRYREILFQKVALCYLLHCVQDGSSKSALDNCFLRKNNNNPENKNMLFFQCSCCLHVCAKTIFLVRALRIHPVQSVINNITQLYGRGFPCIFNLKLFLSQLYVFLCSQMEAAPWKHYILKIWNLKYVLCCYFVFTVFFVSFWSCFNSCC